MAAQPDRQAQRLAAYRRGRAGEARALWWLRCKGYRLVARGQRMPVGEIDLIMRRGRILAFIEVKARPDIEQAAAAIGQRQQARIIRAAEAFMQQRRELSALQPRFDVVLVAPGRLPRHVIDAWRDFRIARP